MQNNGRIYHVPLDAHPMVNGAKFRAIIERCLGTVAHLAIPQPETYLGDDDKTHQLGPGWDAVRCLFHVLNNIMNALLEGEQLLINGHFVGLQQLQRPIIAKMKTIDEFFKAPGWRAVELIRSEALPPLLHEFAGILQWLQTTYRLLTRPMTAGRAMQWNDIRLLATTVRPQVQNSRRLNKLLGHLSHAAAAFADLYTQHGAAFIPAELTTLPFYGLHGRLKAMNGGVAFKTQQAVDYWQEIIAHGEVREGYSKYGNFALNFTPLLPTLRNIAFTATGPNAILPLNIPNVPSPIPAQLHMIRPMIPLLDLEVAFSLAESITPNISAESAVVTTEAFRIVVEHPHFYN